MSVASRSSQSAAQARNCSSSQSWRPAPTSSKRSGRCPPSLSAASPGRRYRPIRSPVPPNTTSRSITSRFRLPGRPCECDAGGDHPDVTERLREVAGELARRGIDLLGQQSQGARPRAQRGIELRCLLEVTLPGEVLDQPEAAEKERALLAGDSVGRVLVEIAVQQAV